MQQTFDCAVTSAPRRTNYLESTVDSILDAGFESPSIYYDGPAQAYSDKIFVSGARLGVVPTFLRALYGTRGKWRVIFQDDVQVAVGLKKWLENNIPDENSVISLYTSSAHDSDNGWRKLDLSPTAENLMPWNNCIGACAMMFPKHVAEKLLEQNPPKRTDRLGGMIGEFCHRNGISLYCHSPSLVQHVGVESTLHRMPLTDERQAKRFAGVVS